jgi:hypothetical protein
MPMLSMNWLVSRFQSGELAWGRFALEPGSIRGRWSNIAHTENTNPPQMPFPALFVAIVPITGRVITLYESGSCELFGKAQPFTLGTKL